MLASEIRFLSGYDRSATRRILTTASDLEFIVCVEERSKTA
jgi:hypothetical protein